MRVILIIFIFSIGYGQQLTIGYTNNFWFLQPFIIKSQGWDHEVGLDFKLQKFISPAAQLQAFLGDRLDGMNNNAAAFIFAKDKKVNFKIIAHLVYGDIALVARDHIKGQNFREEIINFNRKNQRKYKIVTNPRGSLSHLIIEMFLDKKFENYSNYIELVHAGDQVQLQQIYLTKQADAISSFEPFTTIVLNKDAQSKVILSPDSIEPNQLGGFFGIKDRVINDNPEILSKLISIYIKANKFLREQPEKVYELIKNEILLGTLPKDEGVKLVKMYSQFIGASVENNAKQFDVLEKFLIEKKYLISPVKINNSFYVQK